MDDSRKQFIKKIGAAALVSGVPGLGLSNNLSPVIDANDFDGGGDPGDEKFWKQVAKKYYNISKEYINLENGYYGIQPIPVLSAFQKNIEKANKEAARFARKEFPAIQASVKKELASFLDVSDEEIIITRNATEALNIAIQGYPFNTGDEVLLNQLDYFSMIETFRMLEKKGLIRVKTFDMPLLPLNEDEILDVYKKQLTAKTRVILLTHVSNINGLIVPVSRITAMAREKGIDVICDAAHALGQVPFSLPVLGPDIVGLNLHKWIGNPVGAGVLFIRKERVKEMRPLFGDVNIAENNIDKLAHFGTTPFAVIMTIPDSISFHKMLGVDRISKRLRYLANHWLEAFKSISSVEIVTPGGELSCAIASFRIKDRMSAEIADQLFKQHSILTVGRSLGKQGCVRVTPSVYNSLADIQKLIVAVRTF